jgi:two-component system, chemotaxis family, CheB/CheR fusion protein
VPSPKDRKRSPQTEPPARPQLGPVIGMGASAGGLEAFQKFFSRMPPDSGMAFIVVQHLDPHHATMMPELLRKGTTMAVEQVQDETPVEPDRVYVIPPNATLTIEAGVLRVKAPIEPRGVRMPIDSLFHSLAEDQGHRAVCILFSGTGSDGTLGLRSVKEHGGLAVAQTPESARHDSMLRSAIGTGLVDHVLPPEEMPAKLLEHAAYLCNLEAKGGGGLFDETGDQLARICGFLRRKTSHDFSRYKTATLVRRIQRRMLVLQIASASDYVERIRQDPREAEQLFRDLLIGVTQFFRDPQAFAELARDVVPQIVRQAGPDGAVRVWTPGCATGEEAYSVAILLKEEEARQEVRPRVQIFAGDIDDEALEFARQARYPEGIAEHVTPDRLRRFFTKENHSYRVAKEIRELCIFSTHNLIKDAPFSRLDLVVCRNVLIYLEADLQRHVASLFHYALRTGGYLFLGPSESVAGPADLFRTIDKKQRIFQRNETITAPPLTFPLPDRALVERPTARPWVPRTATAGQRDSVAALERILLDHYAPAWVIINAQGESVYFSPRTGKYLEPAVGTPSMDIVSMARKGLRLDLRAAIHKARKTGEPVVHEGVAVETNGDLQQINLIVRPLHEGSDDSGLFLVVFQELGPPKSLKEAKKHKRSGEGDPLVEQLESELRMTKDHLQATIEEVETSNEELRSSNEELLSTNEELQSANEELQTSKEELQSVNEELETINAELGKKVEELDVANGDMQNLLQSTQIPTVFLDKELRIKRFTEAATRVFRLIETDVGRPIGDIAHRFETNLIEDLKEVLRTLAPKDHQVRLADQTATYLMRILPYRRMDNVIDGVVLTFLDVTALNRALEQHGRLAAIVESSQDAIVGRTFDGVVTTWNEAATRMFGYTEAEALGRPISVIVPDDGSEELERVHAQLRRGEIVAPFESVRRTRDGRRLAVSVAISPLKDVSGRLIGSSAIFRDISDLKRAQEVLRKEAHYKDQFLALLSHELRNPLAPLRTSLELLRRRGQADEEVERSLDVMERQLSHMTALVDQLMDASRISSGKIVLNREDLDLVGLFRTAVDDYRFLLERAELRLELHLPARPLFARADRTRLTQALGNLLANAAKFTDRGGTITVTLVEAPNGRSAVLTVRDDGVGIEPDVLARLFQPFMQADPTAGRTRGGLGLGLALVRGLVESHGGSVEARSGGRGKGAEFIIRLPLLTTDERISLPRPEPPDSPKVTRPLRILLVEDNVDAVESLQRLLQLAGHTVETAFDGRTAVEKARAFEPEVVLCDIGLPGDMDGYGVATAIRRHADGKPPYLVALTGFGQQEDRQRTREAGFDWHLTKPAEPDVLQRLLAELPKRSY